MRKILISLMAVVVFAGACLGQTNWRRAYGGTGDDEAKAITPTPDGNFIVAGQTMSIGTGNVAIYLLKIKPDGDTLWTKTYGGNRTTWVNAITPTPDGNFMLAGSTNSFGAGGNDVYLLKIKPTGDTIWTKTYGGTGYDYGQAVTSTPDGNFLVAGTTFGTGKVDVYLLKVNSNGDTLWTKKYGGIYAHFGKAITPTPDGNFIVAGSTSSIGAGDEVYLLKIKPNGDTIWTKTYGGSDNDDAVAITPTPDENFLVAGQTSSFGAGSEVYLLKIKPDGDTLWTKTYEGPEPDSDYASAIMPTPEGNFMVAGHTTFSSAPGSYAYLLKVNPNGDMIWKKAYSWCSANAISPAPETNFIAVGYTTPDSGINYHAWIISIVNCRYAYKDVPFAFKIPVSGDSLNHGYTPLKVPSGMTVSMGGTIAWTPKTDSVYMDHAEFLVTDDFGIKDTLTFDIYVNSKDHPIKTINPVSRSANPSLNDIAIRSLSSKEVRFSLPGGTSSLRVYDVRGQLLENIPIKSGQATWQSKRAAGRYFAKAIWEKNEMVKGFTVVR
jgi:uncharacterized delta-60 repeat protein